MKNYQKKILIVDRDLRIMKILRKRFSTLGYIVLEAPNGNEALKIFKEENPALIITEIILPKLDGYEICREIRKFSTTPILILTTLTSVSNRIKCLKLGADDCIMKPFSQNELELKVATILNRVNKLPNSDFKNENLLHFNELIVNLGTHEIFKNNKKIRLTKIEFSILKLLVENAGKALSRKTMLENLWGYTPERYIDTRIVDVHISRLRAKLESDSSHPDFILTVRGIGYMFPNYLL